MLAIRLTLCLTLTGKLIRGVHPCSGARGDAPAAAPVWLGRLPEPPRGQTRDAAVDARGTHANRRARGD